MSLERIGSQSREQLEQNFSGNKKHTLIVRCECDERRNTKFYTYIYFNEHTLEEKD